MRIKFVFAVFCLLFMLLSSCILSKKKEEKLLNYHWGILCNEVSLNKNDTIYNCCTQSISILESQTGILSNTHGTFFGKLYFTKRDWIKWEEWMKESNEIKWKK